MNRGQYLIYKICVNIISLGGVVILFDNIKADDFLSLVLTGLALTFLQMFIKPILVILTLPIQILSLGIFYVLINSFLLVSASKLIIGFHVSGFFTSFFAALTISIINTVFDMYSNGRVIVYHGSEQDKD